MKSAAEQQHVLVLGAPRSGTTILAAMLSAHPEVAIVAEDRKGKWRGTLSKQVIGVKLLTPNQVEMTRGALETAFWGPYIAGLRVARRLGFRAPWYSTTRSRLSIRDMQALPYCKIVGIIRDPGRVITSIHRRGKQPLGEARWRWTRTIQILHQLKLETPEDVELAPCDFMRSSEHARSNPRPALASRRPPMGRRRRSAWGTADTPRQ